MPHLSYVFILLTALSCFSCASEKLAVNPSQRRTVELEYSGKTTFFEKDEEIIAFKVKLSEPPKDSLEIGLFTLGSSTFSEDFTLLDLEGNPNYRNYPDYTNPLTKVKFYKNEVEKTVRFKIKNNLGNDSERENLLVCIPFIDKATGQLGQNTCMEFFLLSHEKPLENQKALLGFEITESTVFESPLVYVAIVLDKAIPDELVFKLKESSDNPKFKLSNHTETIIFPAHTSKYTIPLSLNDYEVNPKEISTYKLSIEKITNSQVEIAQEKATYTAYVKDLDIGLKIELAASEYSLGIYTEFTLRDEKGVQIRSFSPWSGLKTILIPKLINDGIFYLYFGPVSSDYNGNKGKYFYEFNLKSNFGEETNYGNYRFDFDFSKIHNDKPLKFLKITKTGANYSIEQLNTSN